MDLDIQVSKLKLLKANHTSQIFAQELELNEKLERLSELNALLNMDEKGAEDSLEDQEADAPLSGKEDARTSIMEKLAQFKEQSSQMGIGNNKNKEKAASL